MSELTGWIAVDLDGTLADYSEWKGPEHIGAPVPLMVERVKAWRAEGKDIRIFTARVAHDEDGSVLAVIDRWCEEHLGERLPVTNTKDYGMVELWDDRCVQIIPNTGVRADAADAPPAAQGREAVAWEWGNRWSGSRWFYAERPRGVDELDPWYLRPLYASPVPPSGSVPEVTNGDLDVIRANLAEVQAWGGPDCYQAQSYRRILAVLEAVAARQGRTT